MFAKVLIVCAVAAAALATEYPAGLHPSVCPNYPYCDAEVLARHTPDGMPIPDWELPYARMAYAPALYPYFPKAIPTAPAKIAAHEYPADFDPASCPNYPYCA